MSQETQQIEFTKKTAIYRIPGMDAVTIRKDIVYRETGSGALTLDIYYPHEANSNSRIPAVIFVTGYPDEGFQARLGCKQKEMGSYISWGQLTAASGIAAITYTNSDPATDIHAVLRFLRQEAVQLGIDENKIGLWACSGNVPLALSVLVQEAGNHLKCAALCYGYMFDLENSTVVTDAARQWGFANPAAGKSVVDLPQDLPLFIVRAGQDQMPHLNETIDRFLVKAIASNLPIIFANHASAPHAFDLFDDSQTSEEIIKQILTFMQFHLLSE